MPKVHAGTSTKPSGRPTNQATPRQTRTSSPVVWWLSAASCVVVGWAPVLPMQGEGNETTRSTKTKPNLPQRADLNPRPPKNMGRDATKCTTSFSSSPPVSPWLATFLHCGALRVPMTDQHPQKMVTPKPNENCHAHCKLGTHNFASSSFA